MTVDPVQRSEDLVAVDETMPTRERILDASAGLFRRQGAAATGLKEIVRESRAPWGSLYHYFPDGKEQLIAESLLRTGERYAPLMERAFAGAHPEPGPAGRSGHAPGGGDGRRRGRRRVFPTPRPVAACSFPSTPGHLTTGGSWRSDRTWPTVRRSVPVASSMPGCSTRAPSSFVIQCSTRCAAGSRARGPKSDSRWRPR